MRYRVSQPWRLILVLGFGMLASFGNAQQGPRNAPAAGREGQPAVEAPPPALLKPMLALAETLGSLAFLAELCGDGEQGAAFRARMQALIDAEASDPVLRQRLAGAYNVGFQGYETIYRRCTPSARAAIEVLLADGSRLSRDLASRFGN